jgi:RHS repeat-associated protein
MYFDIAYAPFGESYATAGTTDPSFTGQRQDTVSGLYDFPARQYAIQGRWPAPDPSGIASVHLSDPQTWNRYAYVRNNPLTLIDPNGLEDCGGGDNTDGACPDSVGVSAGSPPGGSGGGTDGGPNSGGAQGSDSGPATTCGFLGCSDTGVDTSDSGSTSVVLGNCNFLSCDPTSGGDTTSSGSDCVGNAVTCGLGADPNGNQSGQENSQTPAASCGAMICGPDGSTPDASAWICGSDSCQLLTQITVTPNDGPPLNQNATKIFSDVYGMLGWANPNPRFSENTCSAIGVAATAVGLYTIWAPEPVEKALGAGATVLSLVAYAGGCM